MNVKMIIFAALMLGCLLAGCQPQNAADEVETQEALPADPVIPEADLKATVDGNNAFAFDLYRKLIETEKGNILISPYSIRTALAMAYAGARGQTASEMRTVLHFTLPDDQLHPAVAVLGRAMLPTGPNPAYKLGVANAVWGRTGARFKPNYLALMANAYRGGFRELDFGRDPEGGRAVINGWVADKTNTLIPELLKSSDIHTDTALVLTNAVYFKGQWQARFDTGSTWEENFEAAPGTTVQLPLMHAYGDFRHAEHTGLRAVELPYKGDRLSMVLVLPARRHGLAAADLTVSTFAGLVGALREGPCDLTLPKFKLESRYALKESLEVLGMPSAFVGGFNGLEDQDAAIEEVVHAAVITVDEEGTEAAAATAVTVSVIHAALPFTFRADEPFVYFIRDRVTGTVLFLGRYTGEVEK